MRARSTGIAIVEFVIVLPLCLMLMLATAEFGRAFMQYNTLTQSLRDGARYVASGAIDGGTGNVIINATLRTQTQNLVAYGNTAGFGAASLPGLTAGSVTVADAGSGNVSIAVAYPYTSIFSFIPGFSYSANWVLSGISLQAAMTVRAM
jgi:Flp pilus assembly protein TadG